MTWRSQSLPYMLDTKSFNGIQRFSQDTILGFICHHTIIEQHENVIRSSIHIDFITKMVESSGDITVRDDKCIEVYWRWLSIRRYAGRRLFVVVSYSDAYWIKKSREKTLKISLRVFFFTPSSLISFTFVYGGMLSDHFLVNSGIYVNYAACKRRDHRAYFLQLD